MTRASTISALALAIVCSLSSTWALNAITIKGTKFFDSVSKDQFFIKGVAYQPRGLSEFTDPLAKPEVCKRDFGLIKDLGLNTIRVYQIDPSQNHDECMKLLESYGIYLLLDLTSPKYSIVRNNPEYDVNIWNNVRSTIDAFKGYSNMLGFFVGNEVTNDHNTTIASGYVKALLRDTKNYISSTAPRKIPVGYANNDDPDIRVQIQDYFNCGKEENERIDFFGINLYEWCGADTTYATSGYAERTTDIASYSIPVFLSEFGCNTISPRTFPEVKSIFGPDMTSSWSGGIVYEWSQEVNNYGLVQINPDNTVTPLPDYTNLKTALAPLKPTGVKIDSFTEQRSPSTCPAISSSWEPSTSLPPTPESSACDCMMSTLSCVASSQAVATTDSLGTLLNTICGMTSCDDISSDGKTGVYGKYSFCTPAQKLSYMYNSYYVSVGKKSPATCSFNGMAKLATASKSSDQGCSAIKDPSSGTGSGSGPKTGNTTQKSASGAVARDDKVLFSLATIMIVSLAVDLLNPSHAHEQKTHKLKRLVQSPNSYFMDVKCPGCVQITTVFSHAQTVVMCSSCANVLAQPTGGITRLTEGCSFRRKQA
ncbi:1,3-beta-glucanosyltransferase gas1 [Entomortierella lignicola]|nr:1,3-beta-glucanosyltransferase gas1 [Entomortierella lignicola]